MDGTGFVWTGTAGADGTETELPADMGWDRMGTAGVDRRGAVITVRTGQAGK